MGPQRFGTLTRTAVAGAALACVLALSTFSGAGALTQEPSAVAAAPVAASLTAPARSGLVTASGASLNWAGYVKLGTGFTSTSANWRVPKLLTTYDGYSASWVGIDGATNTDPYLIQTGVEADVINHLAHYFAWWEVITPSDPAPEVRFTTLAVRPGDSISGYIVKGTTGHWTMTLKNNTTRRLASHTSSFAGRGTSAEWIVEDTSVNGWISTAPDWQSVTFSSILVNRANPYLSSRQAVDIVSSPGLLGGLLGLKGTTETYTRAPNSTRNGFTVTWLATGTRSQVG